MTGKYYSDDSAVDPVHGVLKNKLKITNKRDLELKEREYLEAAYDLAASRYSEAHIFTEQDVCKLHALFLDSLYEWAGTYRTVDISSADIRWCHAEHIPACMTDYGRRLAALTPFSPDMPREQVLSRLAELHGELVIIHPFRDGNGRTTRLLGDLLLMQAEHAPIRMGVFDDTAVRQEYHAAIREVWMKAQYDRLISLLDRLVA